MNKHIASFYYFDKSLIVLSATSGSIFNELIATVIGAPVGIASESFSLAFLMSTEITKKLLKIARNKKRKHSIIVRLAGSKSNSIENKISEALINNEIGHKDFMTIINEEKNYPVVKETIRMMKSQRIDIQKINLIEKGKKAGTDEVIKHNEIINNSLKSQV